MAIYRPKGSQVYWLEFWFDGTRYRESTKMRSKTRAREVYDKRRREIEDDSLGIKQRPRNVLLYALAEQWLNAKRDKLSPNAQGIAEYALAHLLADGKPATLLRDGKFSGLNKSELARKHVRSIDAGDIRDYQKRRLAEGASNRTVNIEVSTLQQIMKRAGQWERIKSSDAWAHKDVGMLQERDDAGHALTSEEETMLLLECSRSDSRILRPFVVCLLETGARLNTIRTLTWGAVDWIERCLKIGKDKTRAGSGRIVPLSPRAFETLRMWAENFPDRKVSHYVFPAERYGLNGRDGLRAYSVDPTAPVGTIKTAWASALRRTARHCRECKTGILADGEKGFYCVDCKAHVDELPAPLKVRPHDCRHTAVSRMVAAKIPITTIAKVVGWSKSTTVKMAARYSHPDLQELRNAVNSISGSEESPRMSPKSDLGEGLRVN